MRLTQHSLNRMQQRAVPVLIIEWLIDYGARSKAKEGAEYCYFDKSAKKSLTKAVGKQVTDRLSDLVNKSFAIVRDDQVITAGYINKHIRRS